MILPISDNFFQFFAKTGGLSGPWSEGGSYTYIFTTNEICRVKTVSFIFSQQLDEESALAMLLLPMTSIHLPSSDRKSASRTLFRGFILD